MVIGPARREFSFQWPTSTITYNDLDLCVLFLLSMLTNTQDYFEHSLPQRMPDPTVLSGKPLVPQRLLQHSSNVSRLESLVSRRILLMVGWDAIAQ